MACRAGLGGWLPPRLATALTWRRRGRRGARPGPRPGCLRPLQTACRLAPSLPAQPESALQHAGGAGGGRAGEAGMGGVAGGGGGACAHPLGRQAAACAAAALTRVWHAAPAVAADGGARCSAQAQALKGVRDGPKAVIPDELADQQAHVHGDARHAQAARGHGERAVTCGAVACAGTRRWGPLPSRPPPLQGARARARQAGAGGRTHPLLPTAAMRPAVWVPWP